jgi:hypothetical protein
LIKHRDGRRSFSRCHRFAARENERERRAHANFALDFDVAAPTTITRPTTAAIGPRKPNRSVNRSKRSAGMCRVHSSMSMSFSVVR